MCRHFFYIAYIWIFYIDIDKQDDVGATVMCFVRFQDVCVVTAVHTLDHVSLYMSYNPFSLKYTYICIYMFISVSFCVCVSLRFFFPSFTQGFVCLSKLV